MQFHLKSTLEIQYLAQYTSQENMQLILQTEHLSKKIVAKYLKNRLNIVKIENLIENIIFTIIIFIIISLLI